MAPTEPIAIVGRGLAVPGALTPDELWRAVVAGTDLLSSGSEADWRMPAGSALGAGPDRAAHAVAGRVRGFEGAWDALKTTWPFQVPPETFDGIDPLFRWVAWCSHHALAEAGGAAGPGRTAAVLGNLGYPTDGASRWAEGVWGARNGLDLGRGDPRDRFQGGLPILMLGAALGVTGTRFALDAACASGLTAVALGVDLLQEGAADLVLAGGVNRSDDLFLHVGFQALAALSPTGRSRPFHRKADGLVPAEGAAVVALMRLRDARAAGRHVFGVVRGAGLSNDGRGRGLLVPSSEGQVRALRTAWGRSGLDPAIAGLIECHATGTAVGDGIEAATLRAVFGGAADLPIGSLKGNLGHLITAAGAAALVKVLGAFQHRVRPPTLHVDDPHPDVVAPPLRLLTAAEPWPSDGPRVAALNAFGFGGNNAHLVVSEDDPSIPLGGRTHPPQRIVVTAVGAAVGDGHGIGDFRESLTGTRSVGRAREARLPLGRLRMPPRDLTRSLGQQTRLLEAAFEALGDAPVDRERTGLWIGTGPDAEVGRYGLRWRLAAVCAPETLEAVRDAAMPALDSTAVVGHMPNIPANRIGSQFDIGGPGMTVAAEEASGLVALDLGRRALERGEVDLALVGATDLADEVVHAAAAARLLPAERHRPLDAAVVLVLRREEDAAREGHRVLARFEDGPPDQVRRVGDDWTTRLGHPHAASALVHVVGALLTDAPGALVRVEVDALGDARHATSLRVGADRPMPAPPATDAWGTAAHRPEFSWTPGAVETVPEAPPVFVGPPTGGSGGFVETPDDPAHWIVPQAHAPNSPPAPRPVPLPVPPPAPDVTSRAPAAAPVRAALTHLAAAHQAFLQAQSDAHQAFLRVRSRQTAALLSARNGTAPVPGEHRPPAPVATPTPVLPPAPPKPVHNVGEPIGPAFGRTDLERLASGRISDVFGPGFAGQDGFARQVRMPEPPLLLADRVVGIDAEPGSMGLGTIWTETDVTDASWYLHDGAMPAGILIESGQADLLLISWLGVDRFNRGERVYRLLGCELTYRSGLPTPGTTLRYDIHVDGHAQHGAVRLFFFHYDCVDQNGVPRLQVRQGQAGFFTDAELAESKGILWTPEEGERTEPARVDPPRGVTPPARLDGDALRAFASGDASVFGPGYEFLATHVRTPRISGPPMLFLHSVDAIDVRGGPWGRGYLRATQQFAPDDWFFPGHFKGDPCMPGTLMFEGCLQAMAVYMTALGVTLRRDGWRFEIVPDVPYALRCRGQATPASRTLVYEIFVDEFHDGEHPVLWADFLCTVDGLKAFHARRVGLRLVCDFPISSRPELLRDHVERKPVAVVDGFEFGYRSLMACAWGKPSAAFGPAFQKYDEGLHCARLPGPPYHFMSRVLRVEGRMGDVRPGALVELEYDIPPDAWYFHENGARTMPFCVLLEAALQPCGWLAVYVGSALDVPHDLFFRNLDGDGVLHTELLPESGTLRTVARLTQVSKAGGMIVEGFDVRCTVGDVEVYTLKTVFGFFSRESLANQVGVPPTEAERAALEERTQPITLDPEPPFQEGPALPRPMLRMIDRVDGLWPNGGAHGLGRITCSKEVDPSEWFFKAHFFTDPVQPGSLGLEAMIQALQVFVVATGAARDIPAPRFEPLALGMRLKWKYRGQVVPRNNTVRVEMDITSSTRDATGLVVTGDGWLWVDGLRIYRAEGMAIRVVSGADEVTLDPSRQPWLGDHRPTWTVAALPALDMADRLLGAAGQPVHGLADLRVRRWLTLPARVRTECAGDALRLMAWRNAADPALSRWEPVAEARAMRTSDPRPEPWRMSDLEAIGDPYEAGALFHGPSLRVGRDFRLGPLGASCTLDVARCRWPHGAWGAGLLDAMTHAVPHDALDRWFPDVGADVAAYPYQVRALQRWGPWPESGAVEVLARPVEQLDERTVRVAVQAIADGAVLVSLDLVEILVPKGRIGRAEPRDRLAFLRDRKFVPGLGLSVSDGDATLLADADVRGVDWLPGTVDEVWRVGGDRTAQIAMKEHAAARLGVHPGDVRIDGDVARHPALPCTVVRLHVGRDAEGVSVHGEPESDIGLVEHFWDAWFARGRWPVEDLYYALVRRFIRRVVIEDPEALQSVARQSLLFLGNHQVGIESLLFSIVASGLVRAPTVTVAKAEHRTSWLGTLIADCFSYPGIVDPEVITFFDRDDKESLPVLVRRLGEQMATRRPRNAMVHVEGTRSLECRTPVRKMSGSFIDMAIAVGAPIVPVRFVGGLPVEPLAERIEFPFGLGRQDLYIGRPLLPGALANMTYKQRKDAVIDGINGLGPAPAAETPLPPDPALQERVQAHAQRTGVCAEDAVLAVLLEDLPDPCAETVQIRSGGGSAWAQGLRRRLWGE